MTYQCPSLPPHVLLTLVFGDTTEPAEGEGLGGGGGGELESPFFQFTKGLSFYQDN